VKDLSMTTTSSSNAMRPLNRFLVTCGLMACAALACAQPANTTVLKGKAVTENNLLDALTPDEPVVTRSLRVQRDSPGQQAARKPSASLLITFATNSATLSSEAKKQLDVVATTL
jgi:outer membrane protein OmpA-like peptidoglycan-associated protein